MHLGSPDDKNRRVMDKCLDFTTPSHRATAYFQALRVLSEHADMYASTDP